MTDTQTGAKVEIPADVRDNSPHTVRVVSNGVRAEEGGTSAADHLRHYRDTYRSLGYGMIEFEVTNDGVPAVVTEFWQNGRRVWQFRTEYFTRVPCCTHDAYYAERYASVTDQDGVTTIPAAYCGECMIQIRRSARDSGMTVNTSERLRIGQHD